MKCNIAVPSHISVTPTVFSAETDAIVTPTQTEAFYISAVS